MDSDGVSGDTPYILQVVPYRTSRNDGVGDYARVLADALERRHGIRTLFISGTPAGAYPEPNDRWRTQYIAERSGSALLQALHAEKERAAALGVILHVSGYGYAKRGAPTWLLNGFKRWRTANSATLLLGVFHELYASGKPWNSSFWLGPLQKAVARGLWNIADCGVTTNPLYRNRLRKWRPSMREQLLLMPVPSNVGEPIDAPVATARTLRAVVFGTAGSVRGIYREDADQVTGAIKNLGIKEILDIGPRNQPPPATLGGASIRALGRLSSEAVSEALLSCRFGLMSYDLARLGKSGIFASYASHGVVPVCFGPIGDIPPGLAAGKHLIVADGDVDADSLDNMQQNLLAWYSDHSSAKLADAVAHLMACRRTHES